MSCTKGILNDTLETVDRILERLLPAAFHPRIAFLSGPSFAAEARRLWRGLQSALGAQEEHHDVREAEDCSSGAVTSFTSGDRTLRLCG